MHSVKTIDVYEGAWYLINGCELVEIAGKKINGKINCEITFSRPGIAELQISFLQGDAEVNLLRFRRQFGQLHSLVRKEKIRCKNILKNGGQL
jgi:hypothetical protein